MKKITLANYSGFCFGVNNACKAVENLLNQNKRVCTLGPIIHNTNVINNYNSKGCRIINTPADAMKDETTVIRSHGVSEDVYQNLKKLNINYIDATCPYVLKIHKIIKSYSIKGYEIVIAGDITHPEIIGIIGHSQTKTHCFTNTDDFKKIINDLLENKIKFILVAQTTFNKTIWEESCDILNKAATNPIIFNTICTATEKRQNEAFRLSKANDLMIIIGDKKSSNTKKLFDICNNNTKSILIEDASDMDNNVFKSELINAKKIGVTAGASTPAYIIKEAINTMEEINKNNNEEMDFAQLLEQSSETEKLYTGKRVKGIVTTIMNNEIHVDINAKQAGIVHKDELTDDPSIKIEDMVKKGDEIDLIVLKVNDQEGIVNLSKKRCDAQAGFEKIKEAYDSNAILDGVVTDVVRGGILVLTQGTKVFVPASQVSITRIENLETLLRQNVKLKVIEINDKRNRAIASIKAVLNEERKELQGKFWDETEVGKVYTGEVKSLTAFGAFVDLGGVDGMIHITELSWTRIKHPSEVVNVGDTVEVYIKDLDKEKKRISLGYKKTSDNPWEVFKSNYNLNDEVTVTIVSFTTYGAFARIIPGIDGLIHISQIANQRVEKISDILKTGQEVQAKIIDINLDEKRVSLSMRALLSDEEQKRENEDVDNNMENSQETTEE